jgi:hypothetical protein
MIVNSMECALAGWKRREMTKRDAEFWQESGDDAESAAICGGWARIHL